MRLRKRRQDLATHRLGEHAMPLTDEEFRKIDRVVDLLSDCRSLLFITGAGISADSGLPTYRGIGGLYDADRTEEGLAIEEILWGP